MDSSFVQNRGVNLFPFQRIQDLIRPGLSSKLTLLCAPAGYGKTSTLQIALHPLQHQVVWIHLNEQDNIPHHLVNKLKKAFDLPAPSQDQSNHPLENFFKALMLSRETGQKPLFLVLDDYQVIKSKAIHVELFNLILSAPDTIHIFIATRSMPPFPLSKLRLQGDLVELYYDQLALKPDEIRSLLKHKTGKEFSQDILQTIWQKTEGWLAMICLIASNPAIENEFSKFIYQLNGTSPAIYSYIEDEIYNQLSPSRREILLKTSLVEEFTSGLCEAVAERQDTFEILNDLSRTHGLLKKIPDGYSFHPLLLDFCRHKLLAERPGQINPIHQKAAIWLEQENQPSRALKHWLEIGNYPKAVGIIQQIGWETLQKSGYENVLKWCGRLEKSPDGLPPELSEIKGFALLQKGDIDQAQVVFNELSTIQGMLASVMIARYQGRYETVQQIAQEALAQLPGSELILRSQIAIQLGLSNLYLRQVARAEQAFSQALYFAEQASHINLICIATTLLSAIFTNRGQNDRSIAMLKRALALGGTAPSEASVSTQIRLAQIELEMGNLQSATHYVETGLKHGEGVASTDILAYGNIILGRIARLQMNYLKATELHQTAARLAHKGGFFWETNLSEWMLLHLALDEFSVIKAWATQKNLSPEIAESTSDDCYLVFARYLLRTGEYEAAITTLQNILSHGRKNQWGFVDLAILPWLAAAYLLANDPQNANAVFLESLQISAPQGYCQAYLEAYQDFPETINGLINQAQRTGTETEHLKKLSSVFQKTPSAVDKQKSAMVQKGSAAANQIELRLFGGLRAYQGGVELAANGWRTEKARSLLAYFAVHYDHPVSLEDILEALWPDRSPAETRKLFHTNYYFLKKTLLSGNEDLELFRFRAGKYALNLRYFWIDLMEFDQSYSAKNEPAAYQKALELVNGPCLMGIDDNWAIDVQNQYERKTLELHIALAKHFASTGETTQAIQQATKALQSDPLREDLVRLLIGWHGTSGDLAAAIAVFESYRNHLKTELNIEPEQETILLANRFRLSR